jgi:putative AlgH/UPF0301 family transcriptional regulator
MVQGRHELCRFCLDTGIDLVAPCACNGSQRYVHLNCLRRWQHAMRGDEIRARVCSVCQSPFAFAPAKESWLKSGVRSIIDLFPTFLALIGILAFNHSALFFGCLALLALVSTRTLAVGVLFLTGIFVLLLCFQIRSSQPILFIDERGRTRVALIRRGEPVAGIVAGVLIVATSNIRSGVFRHSVVLLLEHGPQGSRGVIINSEASVPPLPASQVATTSSNSSQPRTEHERDTPSSGDLLGASRRQTRGNSSAHASEDGSHHGVRGAASASAGTEQSDPTRQERNGPPLKRCTRYGGPVRDSIVLHPFSAVLDCGSVDLTPSGHQLFFGGAPGEIEEHTGMTRHHNHHHHHLQQAPDWDPIHFNGSAVWSPGQLDGEIRRGTWCWHRGDVLTQPPHTILPPAATPENSNAAAQDDLREPMTAESHSPSLLKLLGTPAQRGSGMALWRLLSESRELRRMDGERTSNAIIFPNM